VFGAFLVGVAIGDSSHLREQTRTIIHQFVSFIFAPLFFAGIGLKLDFAAYFDGRLTLLVILIACLGKIVGCGVGALWGGIARREAWAIGVAMNARGAMEVIVGLLALQTGLIGKRMFVSLVAMAMVTSLMSGPLMRTILRLKRPRRLSDYLAAKGFVAKLRGESRQEAIRELSQAACAAAGLDGVEVANAVLAREEQGPTGLGDRIAVPHARFDLLNAPVVAVGLSRNGIDFDAPDGIPAQMIFLILTPRDDDGAQVEILADIARTFRHEEVRQKAVEVRTYTEFLAMVRTQGEAGKSLVR
jgi:mannitol/fructose-specific phosphotransferase system IIA component (Ntr-type)